MVRLHPRKLLAALLVSQKYDDAERGIADMDGAIEQYSIRQWVGRCEANEQPVHLPGGKWRLS